MTVLASRSLHICSTLARALSGSLSARSTSMYLPCRTSSTPISRGPPAPSDGLALRVEHAVLEGDLDARFHGVLGSRELGELGTRAVRDGCSTARSLVPSSPQFGLPFAIRHSMRRAPARPRGRGFRSGRPDGAPLPGKPRAHRRGRGGSGPCRACRDWMSHRRQQSGLISSASTMRICSFSQSRPNSTLKSTRRMPMPRKSPTRKSLILSASAMISSISCGVAQPKAVMCSSETIGSFSASFL